MNKVAVKWLSDEQLIKLAKLIKSKKPTSFSLESRQSFFKSCKDINYSVSVKGEVYKFNGKTLYFVLIGTLGKALPEATNNAVEVNI